MPPGDHLDSGEAPHAGALRELREELDGEGQLIDLSGAPYMGTTSAAQLPVPFCILEESIPASAGDCTGHVHLDFIYVAKLDHRQHLNVRTEEIERGCWFTIPDLAAVETCESVIAVCRAISARWQAHATNDRP